jgi:hypothetical protein
MTMSSNDDLATWEAKHAELIRKGELDRSDAQAKLALARKNVDRARASLKADDPDQALVSAETAMVNAADAVLALAGYRIRGKTGSHRARFEYPRLPAQFTADSKFIQIARSNRNQATYDYVGSVSPQLAIEVTEAASRLVGSIGPLIG